MSQFIDIGLSFYLMSKKGNFLEFLSTHISTFHKIKMKTQIITPSIHSKNFIELY